MTKGQKQTTKHVIFSNLNTMSNCDEACKAQGNKGNCDCSNHVLNDERENLNIPTEGRILAIADVGRWNGRVKGYKILPQNVSSILYSECDAVEWYSDGHNVKGTQSHHDGVNYIEYRVIREERNIQNLLTKLYHNEEITRQQINYYTKSLQPYVAKVYGWGK